MNKSFPTVTFNVKVCIRFSEWSKKGIFNWCCGWRFPHYHHRHNHIHHHQEPAALYLRPPSVPILIRSSGIWQPSWIGYFIWQLQLWLWAWNPIHNSSPQNWDYIFAFLTSFNLTWHSKRWSISQVLQIVTNPKSIRCPIGIIVWGWPHFMRVCRKGQIFHLLGRRPFHDRPSSPLSQSPQLQSLSAFTSTGVTKMARKQLSFFLNYH